MADTPFLLWLRPLQILELFPIFDFDGLGHENLTLGSMKCEVFRGRQAMFGHSVR